MALDGGDVAPADRTGERAARTEGGDVGEAAPRQVEEGLDRRADAGRHPLGLAEQRDQVVRGDDGGGVVARPAGLGHVHDPTAQAGHDLGHERVAVLGQPEPGADEALGAPLGVGQRDERVQHGPAAVRRERVEPGRARQVGDDRALDRLAPRGPPRRWRGRGWR